MKMKNRMSKRDFVMSIRINQYKDALVIAACDPIIGSSSGLFPNASSNKSTGFSPFFRVSKLNG